MERNKYLKIIQAINTEMNALERERNVYLNLLCEDISGDTEEFILATLRDKRGYCIFGRDTGGSVKWI